MLAQLASMAVTFAVLLFLVSLLFGESTTAAALRRGAAFSFILAFVPSLVLCIVQALIPRSQGAVRALELVLGGIGLFAVLGLLSLAAYGFLDLRKRAGTRIPPIAEGVRQAKRRTEETRRHEPDSDEDSSL